MGNDSSRLKGLEIDPNPQEVNDYWSLNNATLQENLLSIFTGETVVTGQIWVTQGPLERFIRVSCLNL